MNLSKAIQIGELNLKLADKKMPPDVKDALSLLTEAGKQIKESRKSFPKVPIRLLPGETKY